MKNLMRRWSERVGVGSTTQLEIRLSLDAASLNTVRSMIDDPVLDW